MKNSEYRNQRSEYRFQRTVRWIINFLFSVFRFPSSVFRLPSSDLRKGYTLAELLAVISIFVIITGVVISIVSSTFRGSARTKITTEVSQNGQYAIDQIREIISDSRNVLAVNGTSIDDCTASPTSASSITLKRIDGGTTIISCEKINNVDTIASNSASMINNGSVKALSCSFSCTQIVSDPYSIPRIDVSFNLSQVGANSLFENQSNSTFKTSTSLRVYSP